MSIRNIISLVESVAPSVKDIEESIAHERDEQAVADKAEELDEGHETEEDGEPLDLEESYALALEALNMDWQSRFRREMDRQPKTTVGFERACDAARLTPREREMAREDTLALSEDEDLEEGRHGIIPSSMLGGRWDAKHLLDVKDEVEARGGDLTNPEHTKAAAADLSFADRALPNSKPGRAIRGIKENSRGMFVIEDFDEDEEPCECADKVKPGQAYHCPICDADWEGDEEELNEGETMNEFFSDRPKPLTDRKPGMALYLQDEGFVEQGGALVCSGDGGEHVFHVGNGTWSYYFEVGDDAINHAKGTNETFFNFVDKLVGHSE